MKNRNIKELRKNCINFLNNLSDEEFLDFYECNIEYNEEIEKEFEENNNKIINEKELPF